MGVSSSAFAHQSPGGAKLGGGWTGTLYFNPYADRVEGRRNFVITNGDLINFSPLVYNDPCIFNSLDEQIEEVFIFKHPLTWWQIIDVLFNHIFVVFKTKTWWWSIEKNSEGITIQRSKDLNTVKDYYRRNERVSRITVKEKGYGNKTVESLRVWLYAEGELQKTYHYLFCNCKHFAHEVFKYVTQVENN